MSLKKALGQAEKEMFKAEDNYLDIEVLIEEYKNGNVKHYGRMVDFDRWSDEKNKYFGLVFILENYGHTITNHYGSFKREWCLILPVKSEYIEFNVSYPNLLDYIMKDDNILKYFKETHNYSIKEYHIDWIDVFGYSIKPIVTRSSRSGVTQKYKMEIFRKEELLYESYYGTREYAEAKAKHLIMKFSDGYHVDLISDDWKEKLQGKSVWYKGIEYIIEYIIPTQCCIIAYPKSVIDIEDYSSKFDSLKAEVFWDVLYWYDPNSENW